MDKSDHPAGRAANGDGGRSHGHEEAAYIRVINAVKELISSGELRPGQRIVEAEIIQRLGVSRSSVREGLRLLSADGIVSVEHNRGVTVRSFNKHEVLALHQIREVLEGLAAGLAAGRADSDEFHRRLSEVHAKSGKAVRQGDAPAYIRLNEQFHALIVEMSGNAFIGNHIAQGKTAYFRLQAGLLSAADMARSLREHQAILDAVLGGQVDEAEQAMRRHIRSSKELILRAYRDKQ